MAGRMVEAVAGELSKIREKVVRIKALDFGQNMSKFKAARAAEVPRVEVVCKDGGGGKQLAKANMKVASFMMEEEEDGYLSESTVCLLMDRFVPC